MEFNIKRFRFLFFLFAVLTPIALGARLYILFATVDPETGFFRSSSLFCTVFNVVSLALFFGVIFSGLLFRKKTGKKKKAPVKAEAPETDEILVRADAAQAEEDPEDPDLLQGVCAESQTWHGTVSAFLYFLLGLTMIAAPILSFFYPADLLERLAAVFQIAAGLSFLIAAVKNSKKKRTSFPLLSLTPVIYFALRMVAEYHTMDHPNKAIYAGQLLFLLSALLFFLYQAELSFGHESYCHTDLYAGFALLTVFFGLGVVLPRFLAMLFGGFSPEPVELAAILSDLVIPFFAGGKILALPREI